MLILRTFMTGRGALVAAPLLLALVVACSDSATGPAGEARVQIQLKDFPAELVATADVWISRVYLQGDEGGPVDLFNDPANPRHYDLLTLQDGVVADLTAEEGVPEGRYNQLRLVVDSARVSLAEGVTFRDGTSERTLFVPSGAQTGIKVQLHQDIEAEGGTTTVVLVDMDVSRNFVFQGSAAAGFHGVLFTPVIQEERRTVRAN